MKKLIFSLLIVVSILQISCGCSKQQTKIENNPKSNDNAILKNVDVDKNYLLALNVADQFLSAWLMRDQNKGLEFVTENLKNSLGENGLFAFFVGTSNPHHQGFEIIGREHINGSTIRFNVWLYEDVTGETPMPVKRGNPYYIDVVKSTEYIWLVNNLPQK